MASENLTIEEIGKRAGVSRSTVSRVINNHPDVRESVRERVEAVIAETGYEPNQAARALVSNRTGLIGLIMFTEVDQLFGDPYYSALVDGIQRGCVDHDLKLAIFPLQGCPATTDTFPAQVAQGFVDGVIVTASTASEPLIAALKRRGKRMVVVGHPIDDEDILRVDVTNRVGTAEAVTHLLDQGRQRIAFVGVRDGHVFAAERRDGYLDALAERNIEPDAALMAEGSANADGGYEATKAVLDAQPDGLFVCIDTMAIGAYQALAEQNLSIPGDVAVVGFDGLPRGPVLDPVLTTVVQPAVEVGRLAVDMLTSSQDGPQLDMLATELRIAASSL